MAALEPKRAGDAIDRVIGAKLRAVRLSRNLKMEQLASRLQLSPQQIGKYERGVDRISASTLWRSSAILDIRVGRFYVVPEGKGRSGFSEGEQARFDRTAAPARRLDFLASLARAPLSVQRQILHKALLELTAWS